MVLSEVVLRNFVFFSLPLLNDKTVKQQSLLLNTFELFLVQYSKYSWQM